MAMLAPYTNAMRLGQGFNSYTQQICLDRAVVIPPVTSQQDKRPAELARLALDGAFTPETSSSTDVHNLELEDGSARRVVKRVHQGQSQIVTYTAKFIDKLSDITESLNVSASLSIKTATIGGTVKGSYVDTDKFKSSDLNFTIQVKVVNQRLEAPEYSKFNAIENSPELMRNWTAQKFTQVYGWETGGELNALISVKMLDKSKTNKIKGELEGSLGTPALSCSVTGGLNKESNHLDTSTETTVSVNWSGGGRIKDENVLWSINSLTLAAANFPDRVAETPQKIYAILTKYVNLYDYQKNVACSQWSPLVYENANIYTNALLDSFMDFKSIWKQIQIAMWEVENKRATVQIAKFSQAMTRNAPFFQNGNRAKAMIQLTKLLSMLPLDKATQEKVLGELEKAVSHIPDSGPLVVPTQTAPAARIPDPLAPDPTATATLDPGENQHNPLEQQPGAGLAAPGPVAQKGSAPDESWKNLEPNLLTVKPYDADLFGLERARRDCRLEMVKIVNEVEAVTFHPEYSLDPRRDSFFLPPVVYRQMLPVVTMSDSTERRILGTSDEAEFPLESGLWLPQDKQRPFALLEESIHAKINDAKPMHFRIDGWSGQDTPNGDTYFNHIDWLEPSNQPQRMESWYITSSNVLVGLRITFTNGSVFLCGTADPSAAGFSKAQIDWERNQQALFVNIGSSPVTTSTTGQRSIDHLSLGFTSDKGGQYKSLTGAAPLSSNVVCFKIPLSKRFWDLRGFYGAWNTDRISMLGPIWCNHQNPFERPPTAPVKICPDMDKYGEAIRQKLLDYQKDEFGKCQLSKLAAQAFVHPSDVPSANGFFCTLSDFRLRGKEKLTRLAFGYTSDKNWMQRLWLGNASMPEKEPMPGFGGGTDPNPTGAVELLVDEDIVSCTIFSASTGGNHCWIVGVELQIETTGALFVKHRVKLLLSPEIQRVYDEGKPGAWVLHSEVMQPPSHHGTWVIRGFWGISGDVMDRLGVVWVNIEKEEKS